MGTASTMAAMAEALGMTLPGAAAIPAPDSRRLALAEASGRRIVEMVAEDLRPSRILTNPAFENAVAVNMAIGGSTNAVVHLVAIAGRAGVPLSLADFDRISRRVPTIVNLKPSGEYLMEDFFQAGGVPAVIREILPLIDGGALTANGRTIGENNSGAECWNRDVVRSLNTPLHHEGGTAVLFGNLAPRGAVLKVTAATGALLQHRGPAYVFENRDQMMAEIDRDDLPVDEHTVLVMKNCGPLGGPGMPEWGQIPLPRRLLKRGVKDMVRVSDARMSGTSFGTVVLHVAPESAAGGPLAIVRTGDEVVLDTAARRIDLDLADSEFARRMSAVTPPAPYYQRGYGRMFLDNVLQADEGCDFRFLRKL
jgi:dihydroxy-acid dehydratase